VVKTVKRTRWEKEPDLAGVLAVIGGFRSAKQPFLALISQRLRLQNAAYDVHA
jgi:hypothetical protein